MYCKECGQELRPNADVCVVCGVAVKYINPQARSRMAYILLGLLLGMWMIPGIHNLYAGYITKGVLQLLLTIFSCGILWIPIYIWIIIEVCTVEYDADGVAFTS